MGRLLLLFGFLTCGTVLMDGLLPHRNLLVRIWMGLCAGLMLMMWLPTLFAFFIDFTRTAQLLGLALAALMAAASWAMNLKKPYAVQPMDMPIWLPIALIVPLAILSAYLQYTHILREVDGALHVGQSTYGDLCLHLGIATSLRNASYRPDYHIQPVTLM